MHGDLRSFITARLKISQSLPLLRNDKNNGVVISTREAGRNLFTLPKISQSLTHPSLHSGQALRNDRMSARAGVACAIPAVEFLARNLYSG
jgi:hypothetical protein